MPLLNIGEKLNYLAGILLIDCSINPNDFDKCKLGLNKKNKNKEEDNFPIISIFVPPELRINPYTKKIDKHYEKLYDKKEYSENLVYSFITSNILNKGLKLDNDNINTFLENHEYNKLILFTDKKQTPLIFRGLTNYYYNQLMLGEIEKEQYDLIKRFNVTKFPTLMVYKTQENAIDSLDKPVMEFYKGKINSKDIIEFLKEFVLPNKKYLNKKLNIQEGNNLIKKIETIDNDFFKKNKGKRIILYLPNKETEEEKIPEYLNKFYDESNGFFYFFKMSCEGETNTNKDLCIKINKKNQYPTLLMMNKDLDNIESLEKFLKTAENLPLTFDDIKTELYIYFSNEITIVNKSNFQMSVSGAMREKKVPIFYFSNDKNIPLGLHLLSMDKKILENVSFFSFPNPSKEIIKNFNIKSLPELIIILDNPDDPGR